MTSAVSLTLWAVMWLARLPYSKKKKQICLNPSWRSDGHWKRYLISGNPCILLSLTDLLPSPEFCSFFFSLPLYRPHPVDCCHFYPCRRHLHRTATRLCARAFEVQTGLTENWERFLNATQDLISLIKNVATYQIGIEIEIQRKRRIWHI